MEDTPFAPLRKAASEPILNVRPLKRLGGRWISYEAERVELSHPGRAARQKRVLLADDDADVCALLARVLMASCEVFAVHDAEAALRLLEAEAPFDLIISDFMLPGMSGIDFAGLVRAKGVAAPILMITGHDLSLVDEGVKSSGVNALLNKPFTLAQLRATIGALLGGISVSYA
jgi:CheY-like chemotaxis protein